MSKRKRERGVVDVGVGGFFDGVSDVRVRDLMVVRYVSYMLGCEGVSESDAISECSRVSGLGVVEVRRLWDRRGRILGVSSVEYQMSGDLIREKVRLVYNKFLDELYGRELGGESVKLLLEALRVISQLEVSLGVALSVTDPSLDGVRGDGNMVSVKNSNVIIVPMPDSAKSHTSVVDGRVVSDVYSEGKSEATMREFKAKMDDARARMESEVEMDALEEVAEMARRVAAVASGDRGDG